MLNRRQFLQAGVSGLALAGLGVPVRAGEGRTAVLSAVSDARGRHFIAGLGSSGGVLFRIPVQERCHGGCARPGAGQVVMFARRSGRHFHVVDPDLGEIVQSVAAGPEVHFYGHGVFSPDGNLLYVTANHFPSGRGLVQVYDASDGYRHLHDLDVNGIGPHELRLHPDGKTLIVAVGGIRTHPDYGRVKLNLSTMAPALVLMDRSSGNVRKRYAPSHHQLSCRHLDLSPDGYVVAGYQYEGPEWERPPLLARLDAATGSFSEISLAPQLQASLGNYIASVAVSPGAPVVAVTAPRGNTVLLLDYRTGRPLRSFALTDCAGVAADGTDGFLLSTGTGRLYRASVDSERLETIGRHPLRWDNHLALASPSPHHGLVNRPA